MPTETVASSNQLPSGFAGNHHTTSEPERHARISWRWVWLGPVPPQPWCWMTCCWKCRPLSPLSSRPAPSLYPHASPPPCDLSRNHGCCADPSPSLLEKQWARDRLPSTGKKLHSEDHQSFILALGEICATYLSNIWLTEYTYIETDRQTNGWTQ